MRGRQTREHFSKECAAWEIMMPRGDVLGKSSKHMPGGKVGHPLRSSGSQYRRPGQDFDKGLSLSMVIMTW